MQALAQHRADFAKAHGGYYTVQLRRPVSILPGVVITPESASDDGRTVVYTARPVDDLNPQHLGNFNATVRAIPERADFSVVSTDDLGGFATWAMTYDRPVFAFTA